MRCHSERTVDLELAFSILTLTVSLVLLHRFPYALVALHASVPLFKNSIQPFLLFDLTLLLAVLSVSLLAILIVRHAGIPRVDVLLLLMLFFTIVLIGTPLSPNDDSFRIAIEFAMLTLIPLLPLLYLSKDEAYKRDFLITLVCVGLFNLGLGLISLGGSGMTGRLELNSGNTIAVSRAVFLIPMILVSVRHVLKGARGWWAIGASGLAILVSLSTGSRGPMLAAVIAISIAVVLDHTHWRRSMKSAINAAILSPGLAILAGLLWTSLPEQSTRRILSPLESLVFGRSSSLDTSSLARLDFVTVSLEMASQHPFLGAGVGSFATYSSDQIGRFGSSYPHNLFLQALAELGIVGLVVLIALVLYCFIRSVVTLPQSPLNLPFFTLACGMVINGLFSHSLYDFRLLWAALIGTASLAVAGWQRNGQQSSKDTLQ